jgi:transposase-like protein
MQEKELRRSAIARYLGGEPPKSIYEDLGRTKQWFFKWLKRYQSGDPNWFSSKSKAPKHRPREISQTTRDQIVKVRSQLQRQPFAQVGVSAIKWELHKIGAPLPSDRTINRVLRQEGLIKKKPIHPERG